MNKINKRIGNIEVRVYNAKHEIVCWQTTQGHSHCYVIAFIEELTTNEPDVRIIGTRYWDLSIEDKIDFDAIIEYFFNHFDDDEGDFQQHYEEIQEGLNNLQNDLENIKQKILVFEEKFGIMLRKLQ